MQYRREDGRKHLELDVSHSDLTNTPVHERSAQRASTQGCLLVSQSAPNNHYTRYMRGCAFVPIDMACTTTPGSDSSEVQVILHGLVVQTLGDPCSE